MGDYLKKSQFNLSLSDDKSPKETGEPNSQAQVDTSAIADAVIAAIGQKLKSGSGHGNIVSDSYEDFDETKTMERLAEGMTIQKGDKESNFDDLGNVKESEKREDVQNRIDLLSDLDDE